MEKTIKSSLKINKVKSTNLAKIAKKTSEKSEIPAEKKIVLDQETKRFNDSVGEIQRMTRYQSKIENPVVEEKKEESSIVDMLDFTTGKNTLSIKLVKKPNRMYRVQIYLNENIEIRNATYTGASQAFAFWNLLKNTVK